MADKTFLDLCDEVDDGEWDDGLRDIAAAISSRLEIVSRRTARRLQRSLSEGDRVKLTNGIKPRYLDGMTGIIIKVKGATAVVQLDKMPKRTGAGRPSATENELTDKLEVPFAHLAKVAKGVKQLSEVDMDSDIGDDSDDEGDDD